MIIQSLKKILKVNKLTLFVLIFGSIIHLAILITSGNNVCIEGKCGLHIGYDNKYDILWHLSIINTAFNTFPFQLPIYSGEVLYGYHYLPFLIIHLITFLGIPVNFLYFKVFPILYVLGLSFFSYKFAKEYFKNYIERNLFVFFIFFGTTLSFVFKVLKNLGQEEIGLVPLTEASKALRSVNYAFSIVFILIILLIIQRKQFDIKKQLILAVLIFVSFGFKFYAGIVAVVLVGVYMLLFYLKSKEYKKLLYYLGIHALSAVCAVFVFYNPVHSMNGGSTFIFAPFSIAHHMIEEKTFFFMENMILARYYLYENGINGYDISPKLMAIELFSTFLLLLFYLGTRIVGFLYFIKLLFIRKIKIFDISVFSAMLFAIVFAVAFIQRGDWFNTIQFLPYVGVLISIYCAKLLADLIKTKKVYAVLLVVLILLITIPNNLIQLKYYFVKNMVDVIPKGQMEALKFLKKQEEGTVLVTPVAMGVNVPAFANKPVYITHENVLKNMGINIEKRMKNLENINKIKVENLNIDYIYTYNEESYKRHFNRNKYYEKILENDEIIIFKRK